MAETFLNKQSIKYCSSDLCWLIWDHLLLATPDTENVFSPLIYFWQIISDYPITLSIAEVHTAGVSLSCKGIPLPSTTYYFPHESRKGIYQYQNLSLGTICEL